MDPSKIKALVEIPDIDLLSDDEMVNVAHMRDGRWSAQTKALLKKFKTEKLDLNRGWAASWTGWTCPCCKRDKRQIARMNKIGVLLCRLEIHHDHLAEAIKRIYSEFEFDGMGDDTRIQLRRAQGSLTQLIERFERVVLCIDCNLAEGRAKLLLKGIVDTDFSFSPTEIAEFIQPSPNRVHEINKKQAHAIWKMKKGDFIDRIKFTRKMVQWNVAGKYWREVTRGERGVASLQDRDIVFQQFSRAMSNSQHYSPSEKILTRSTSNDSAGHSPKMKRKPSVHCPSDAEFAVINKNNQKQSPWVKAGEEWQCSCCHRAKREICRKSNKGKWTARIHIIPEYIKETDQESLSFRRLNGVKSLVIGSTRQHFICQDCRHVSSEAIRRGAEINVDCLTIGDLKKLVGIAVPNAVHNVDYEKANEIALANKPLQAAIDDYRNHQRQAAKARTEVHIKTRFNGLSANEVIDGLGYEYAVEFGIGIEEGVQFVDWLLDEARRFSQM